MNLDLHETPESAVGTWEAGLNHWPVVLSVPKGLEGACAGIASREGHRRPKTLCPGFLQGRPAETDVLARALRVAPIWSFGSFFLVATVADSAVASGTGVSEAEMALNSAANRLDLHGEAYWLNCPKNESTASRKLAAQLLASNNMPLRNNPSSYRLTLRLAGFEGRVMLLLGPSISIKERFTYRQADVGASINPVLAAAMVRLAPPVEGGVVLDPTCGSGTLLAERLAFSNEAFALGIDRSTRAKRSFETNLHAGAAAKRFRFRLGDGADPENWRKSNTVLANLPFGMRVRKSNEDLEALYAGVMTNAADFLEPDGRLIVTSSFKTLLIQAIAHLSGRLRVLARYRAEMGGIHYQIVVASKRRRE